MFPVSLLLVLVSSRSLRHLVSSLLVSRWGQVAAVGGKFLVLRAGQHEPRWGGHTTDAAREALRGGARHAHRPEGVESISIFETVSENGNGEPFVGRDNGDLQGEGGGAAAT